MVGKACILYAAYSVEENWRPARVPRLTLPEHRLEKEAQSRFDFYKEDRRELNLTPNKRKRLSTTEIHQNDKGNRQYYIFHGD